jgi:hypothetical protein
MSRAIQGGRNAEAIQADVGGRASRSAARALDPPGPEKYRERAPHTVKLPDGGDALMIEGQPLLEANFLDLRAGRAAGTWQPFGLKVADAAGTGGPEQRVKEQDQDGMDAEVLFAAMVAGPVFWRNIAHDESTRR